MPRRILSKTKSKIEAGCKGKSKNKVFQDLAMPRRVLSKAESKIEAGCKGKSGTQVSDLTCRRRIPFK